MDHFNNIIFVGLIIIVVARNIIKFMSKQDEPKQATASQEVQGDWANDVDVFEKRNDNKKEEMASHQEKVKPSHAYQNILIEDAYIEENNYDLTELSEAKKAFIYAEIFNRKY